MAKRLPKFIQQNKRIQTLVANEKRHRAICAMVPVSKSTAKADKLLARRMRAAKQK